MSQETCLQPQSVVTVYDLQKRVSNYAVSTETAFLRYAVRCGAKPELTGKKGQMKSPEVSCRSAAKGAGSFF